MNTSQTSRKTVSASTVRPSVTWTRYNDCWTAPASMRVMIRPSPIIVSMSSALDQCVA